MSYSLVSAVDDESMQGDASAVDEESDVRSLGPTRCEHNATASEKEQARELTQVDVVTQVEVVDGENEEGARSKDPLGRPAKKEHDVSSRTPRRVRRGGVMPYSPEIPLPCCAKIGRIQYAEAVFSRVYCLSLNRNRVRLPSADVGHEDVFHGTSLEHDFLPLATHSAVHRLVRSLRDAQPRVVCCALRRD